MSPDSPAVSGDIDENAPTDFADSLFDESEMPSELTAAEMIKLRLDMQDATLDQIIQYLLAVNKNLELVHGQTQWMTTELFPVIQQINGFISSIPQMMQNVPAPFRGMIAKAAGNGG